MFSSLYMVFLSALGLIGYGASAACSVCFLYACSMCLFHALVPCGNHVTPQNAPLAGLAVATPGLWPWPDLFA